MDARSGKTRQKEENGNFGNVKKYDMRIYISGQITGLSVEEYTERFNRAEAYLTGKGYEV